eukprot:1179496-Rhodomonas_salina.2
MPLAASVSGSSQRTLAPHWQAYSYIRTLQPSPSILRTAILSTVPTKLSTGKNTPGHTQRIKARLTCIALSFWPS